MFSFARPALRLTLLAASFTAATIAACGSDDEVAGTPTDAAVDAKKKDSGPRDTSVEPQDTSTPDTNSVTDAFVWPDCASQPAGVPTKTISEIWTDNPATEMPVWISGVYITAITRGACSAGQACQIFVQQEPTFASLAAGAKKAIRLFVSSPAATYFSSFSVGDRVDVYGHAFRVTNNGQNELIVAATAAYPGCGKKVGTGALVPIPGVTLADLTVAAYEDQVGPLLVKVDAVTGTPQAPGEIFGLGNSVFDGGASGAIVSLSPFCLPGASFSGLTNGAKTKFTSVAGVFGMFIPPTDASVSKYLVVYPRTSADMVIP